MDVQIERAVEAAYDPRSDPSLKQQAFEFINQLRSSREGWSICLTLALRREPTPPSEVVRHVALDLLIQALKSGQLSEDNLRDISSQIVGYIEKVYRPATIAGGSDAGNNGNRRPSATPASSGQGAAPPAYSPDSATIQNKLTQALTALFVLMYDTMWPSFFADILKFTTLHASTIGANGTANGTLSPSLPQNAPGTVMYLKILISIHDEIAEVTISRESEDLKRDNRLKDLIRERDMRNVAASWHEILAQWRGNKDAIVELCLTCVGRWVAWIDISLVVNDSLLGLLFDLLDPHLTSQEGFKTQQNRNAAIETFIEILSKKMSSSDKLELIRVLRVDEVVGQLVNGRALLELRHSPDYDTDLAEDAAKLVNSIVVDIVKALDSAKSGDPTFIRGNEQLKVFLPHALRFLSDEYDEICSTIIPSVTDFLNLMRKRAKANDQLASDNAFVLPLILDVIMRKVKYDDTAIWGSEDTQTDEAEFQDLRKRLHILQQAIASVDENMYIDKILNLVITTLDAYKTQAGQLDWRDLELALNQLFLFGELAVKSGGLYSKTKPISPAAERLISMMFKLMEIDIAASSHPAVLLEFMEICVRYHTFFEANPQFITRILENFVAFVHLDHPKVRLRSWYLLQRFVRHVRAQVGNIAETVIQAFGDLLPIRAEASEVEDDDENDEMSSNDTCLNASARFNSQLYLYETVGCITSVKAVPIETQIALMRSVMEPLFRDVEGNLGQATSGNKLAVLQVHHLIMALGTLVRGFSDWTPSHSIAASSLRPDDAISAEFCRSAEVTLVALESLKHSAQIREAARFAFARFIGVLGNRILSQLPRWIEGLLTPLSSRDEMALFMRLLDQVVFGFKQEIFDILNSLLTPFLQRVFAGISEESTGTDDEIQLAELKREYLAFLTVILSNDLEGVLVSQTNQPTFGLVISTIEHFARDAHDCPTAKLALLVLNRMIATWGGEDIAPQKQQGNNQHSDLPNGAGRNNLPPSSPSATQTPKPKLEGFDQFMMSRFSPLCWALPSNPSFDPKDAQSKQVLSEGASLQKSIYAKTGNEYLNFLRNVELSGMGMQPQAIDEYLVALQSMDLKAFQTYFKNLFTRNAR